MIKFRFLGVKDQYEIGATSGLGVDVYWRKKAIQKLKNVPHAYMLDVATGTADLAIEATKILQPVKVVGMDISKEMLRLGDKKIQKAGLENIIVLENGDSEKLRYDSASFDVTMSAFGVRNFENLLKGLQEMYRVLKPGGTIMVLEFSKPFGFPLKQLFGIYFKYILPLIGRIKSKDPKAYTYLYESVQVFPDYDKFSQKLLEAGFKEATFFPLTGGICTIYIGKK